MNIHDVFARLSPRFRRRRMTAFLDRFQPGRETRILDVGGYPEFWAESSIESHITILNVHPIEVKGPMQSRCTAVVGDGTGLNFRDGEFDIVFSNSVIEHLHTWEAQQRFAREIRRVGRRHWVQTPAYEFFLEPHLLMPGFHWMPRKTQHRLARRFTIWGLVERPTPQRAADFVSELRLLKYREFAELFPGSSILRERFCGLTKSYVAYTTPG